jgi:thiaminase
MPIPTAKPTLTTHLTSLSIPIPYTAATEHSFLSSAGAGTLSSSRLSLWLAQDRLYAAHAYPRFIGRLLTSIPYSSLHALDSPQEAANDRILKILVYALDNVVREVGFFGEVAQKWDLQVKGWRERKGTRDYTAEMARVSTEGTLEDGLIFLWAMERVRPLLYVTPSLISYWDLDAGVP